MLHAIMTVAVEKSGMTDWTDVFLGTLFPAVPVPFDEDGEPDFDALGKIAQWMRKQPVDGVAVWTRTGRGSRLPREQRLKIFDNWLEALEGLRFIAEIAPPHDTPAKSFTKKAVEVAQDAVGKATYFIVSSPAVFRDVPDRNDKIIEHHRAIAELGVPLIISCSSPSTGGITYSHKLLSELLEMEEVAAVLTDLPDNPSALQDLITHLRVGWPGIAILSGEDRMYGYTFYRGCHGSVAAIGSVCPHLQRELIDAWFMGDSTKFLNLSRLADHIAEAICIEPREGTLQRILTALAHQGIISEEVTNDPWGPPVSPQEEELVRATLDALGEWSDGRES
jgi:4-hydroxy-tetrahydrodipicolinate synthase